LATYTADRPEVHDIIAEMRHVLDGYEGRMLVGEIYLPLERLITYYGEGGAGVHMPFNFQLIALPWNAQAIASAVRSYEAALPPYGWPNWVLGNHDNPRIASRVGGAQARVAAMLLLTLRGTPTLYYGDEIGMHDVPIPPECVRDPFEKNVPGLGLGRDPERTPMQWDAGPSAGFTTGTPWLPLAEDYRAVNVAAQRDDPASMLTLYQRLIRLRREEPALAVGAFEPVPAGGDLIAYRRRDPSDARSRRFLIVLNLGSQRQTFRQAGPAGGRVVLSTLLDREGEQVKDAVDLRDNEGIIVELGGPAHAVGVPASAG
jgi:alpha-glucosidase